MISFGGVTPGPLFRGRFSPEPFLSGLCPGPCSLKPLGFSFLSHGRKKRNKESPPAARISVKMEHVRLKHKNSELCSSNSLCFFTPSVLHFLNLKSMRPETAWGVATSLRSLLVGVGTHSSLFKNTNLKARRLLFLSPTFYKAFDVVKFRNKRSDVATTSN